MNIITSKTLDNRRRFIRKLAAGGAFFSVPGLYAEALTLTPEMTQGPYYPLAKNIPLDKDNDLVRLDDSLTPAEGLITHLSGRVLDKSGNPIKNALVELWHADHYGEYTYDQSADRNPRADANFAGFGQCLSTAEGGYRFRTIKAGLYRGRTRHYHVGITLPGEKSRKTTQVYWSEVPMGLDGKPWETTNENDGVLRSVRDATQRASVIREFIRVADSAVHEEAATWDIVMGVTPVEPTYPETEEGSLMIDAKEVRTSDGRTRYQVSLPGYSGYSYEVYANPTMGSLGWAALPFSIDRESSVDRNIITAEKEGPLTFFVDKPSIKGVYHVAFRVPGANAGTPGDMGGMGPGGPPPGGGPRGPGRGGPPRGQFGPPPGGPRPDGPPRGE